MTSGTATVHHPPNHTDTQPNSSNPSGIVYANERMCSLFVTVVILKLSPAIVKSFAVFLLRRKKGKRPACAGVLLEKNSPAGAGVLLN